MEKRKRKKAVSPWLLCLYGTGTALASYLLGLLLLTALMMKGAVSEEKGGAVIAAFCLLSVGLGGLICGRGCSWGPLPGALAVTGLFTLLLCAGAACMAEPMRTGAGGVLLGCALIGGMLSGVLCTVQRGKRRKKRLKG